MPEHFFRKLMNTAGPDKGFSAEDRCGLAQFLKDMVSDNSVNITMVSTPARTEYVIASRDKSFQATVKINKHPINVSLKKK